MNTYRSLATIQAVQFQGQPIENVTCLGSHPDPAIAAKARQENGCDPSRAHHPHVHTKDTGGMQVIAPGWWIFPILGGPWGACTDEKFRQSWEVPAVVIAPPYVVNLNGDGFVVSVTSQEPTVAPTSNADISAKPAAPVEAPSADAAVRVTESAPATPEVSPEPRASAGATVESTKPGTDITPGPSEASDQK